MSLWACDILITEATRRAKERQTNNDGHRLGSGSWLRDFFLLSNQDDNIIVVYSENAFETTKS